MKILKTYKQFENINNPIFSVIIDNDKYVFELKVSDNSIDLLLDGELYQNLSVEIPDTKLLSENEFFLNPEVKQRIIDILIMENFIEKTGKNSIAGDIETTSYKLTI